MPKIQRYVREYSIPGKTGEVFQNVGAAGAEWGAAAQAGRVLTNEATDISTAIARHQEKLRLQDIENKYQIAASAYNEDQRKFKYSEDQQFGEQAYTNMERGVKFRDESVTKYTDGITDPQLKSKIENHIRSKSESLLDHLAIHQATQRKKVTETAVENLQSGLLKDAYDGDDLKETITEFRKAVTAQYQTGAMGEDTSVERIMKGESAIAEAHLDGLINRNPAGAIAEIKAGRYKEFLTQKQIETYDKKAKDLTEALKKDADAQLKEVERQQKEKLKADREVIGNDFVSKLVSGKLTRADVLKSNLEPTGENGKQYWINQLDQMEKKAASSGDEGFKTDKSLDGRLFSQIVLDPESVSEAQIIGYIGNGLSRGNADSLLAERKSRLKKDKDTVREQAEKDVLTSLNSLYQGGMFGKKNDPASRAELDKQRDAFRRWMTDPKNKDKDPVIDYLEKITQPVITKFMGIDFLAGDKPNPKMMRESMEKSGEIPTKGPATKQQASFDEANLQRQGQWVAENETQIIKKLAGKPAGTYKFPGNNIPLTWDGKGHFTYSVPQAGK